MSASRVTSDFALVSIRKGRKLLDKRLGTEATGPRIPITLTGYLNYAWGRDDGTDQEFVMTVTSIECDPDKIEESAS